MSRSEILKSPRCARKPTRCLPSSSSGLRPSLGPLVWENTDKQWRHMNFTQLSGCLQVVTSPVHDGWQVAAGCWDDMTSKSESRTKTTASPLTFMRHCACGDSRQKLRGTQPRGPYACWAEVLLENEVQHSQSSTRIRRAQQRWEKKSREPESMKTYLSLL